MCWTGKELDRHIATAGDMPVYKVLLINGDELLSPYRDMPYVENMLYTQNIKSKIGCKDFMGYQIRIEEGLHCYSGSCTVKMKNAYTDKDILVDTKRHFRLYYDSHGLDTDNRIMAVFRGVIPKGTVYYENEHGEIVSEGLKILHRLDVPYFDFKPFRDLKPYNTKE